MMVGLDFWKKKAEEGGLKCRWRLCVFFFLADESMQSEVLLCFCRGTGLEVGKVRLAEVR